MLITFSGLDGSGKTTLITSLTETLRSKGYKVKTATMYYDLSFCAYVRKMRDWIKNKVQLEKKVSVDPLTSKVDNSSEFKWDGKIIDPKIIVDDKKGFLRKLIYGFFRSRFVKRMFLFFDLLDIMIYRFVFEKVKKHILITDRYVYDSLADVVDVCSSNMLFVNMFLKLVPEADVPIFIDVPAETAYIRKQEYPIGYMKWRREVYLKIFKLLRSHIIINNENMESSKKNIEEVVCKRMGR